MCTSFFTIRIISWPREYVPYMAFREHVPNNPLQQLKVTEFEIGSTMFQKSKTFELN